MQYKKIIFVVFFLFSFSFLTFGQSPKVRFSPQTELNKEPNFCKDCVDYISISEGNWWKFKVKLENLSGKDLIVYGQKIDNEFFFLNKIQYKSPDTCQWQYSYGSSENRCDWKCQPSSYKSKIILKPGESVEARADANDESKIAQRYTAYIAENPDEEPYEIYSEPLLLFKELPENSVPILKIVEDECVPNCNLSIEQSPIVRGIKLGMSLEDFKLKFPDTKISILHQDKYNYKTSWLWDSKEDAFSTHLTFLNDKVVRIEVKFKSLENARQRKDFTKLISQTLQLPYFWEPYQSRWECQKFMIEILTNKIPTITIVNKDFIKVQEILVEEDLKKYK